MIPHSNVVPPNLKLVTFFFGDGSGRKGVPWRNVLVTLCAIFSYLSVSDKG